MDLVVLNSGNMPTFARGEAEHFHERNVLHTGNRKKVSNWRLFEEQSLSDHRFISFEIKISKSLRSLNIEKTYLMRLGSL